MSEIHRSPIRLFLLAATIVTVLATPSLSVDMKSSATKRKQDANASSPSAPCMKRSGVPQDYAEAQVVPESGRTGDARAQYNLGIMHQTVGCPAERYEAVSGTGRPRCRGRIRQYNLGFMYFNAQGVPQNYAEPKVVSERREQEMSMPTRILGLGTI